MNIIVYAPNINNGGGLVLLNSVIENMRDNVYYFLDGRIKNQFSDLDQRLIFWVYPNIASRLIAEVKLKLISKKYGMVLLFNGLPPLFRNNAINFAFLQNSLYFKNLSFLDLRYGHRVKLFFEIFLLKNFYSNVNLYLVQTNSMLENLNIFFNKYCKNKIPKIEKLSFYGGEIIWRGGSITPPKIYDFIYIADGNQHKNHLKLIEAWKKLSYQGIKPSLALTVSPKFTHLFNLLKDLAADEGLNIYNLEELSRREIYNLYKSSKALIYPSFSESLGLPLIEASKLNIPIIASELDFVRDSCVPIETFDPHSPLSISRAVMRYLGIKSELDLVVDASYFLSTIKNKYRQGFFS